MRHVCLVVLLAAAGGVACKDEAKPEQTVERDAGLIVTELESRELGVRVPLLPAWRAAEIDPPRPGEPETVAAARRVPQKRTFVAAPRLVMTVEPTEAQDVEPLVRATLAELKTIAERPNVNIIRTAQSTRPISGATLGDLELVYRMKAGGNAKSVIHRSVLVIRNRPDGGRSLVTITATYLSQDRELVGAEVQVMLDGVELFEPPQETK